ncbi:hypothetical protein ABT071_21730 [Streptomyces sp. NPDC002506]
MTDEVGVITGDLTIRTTRQTDGRQIRPLERQIQKNAPPRLP